VIQAIKKELTLKPFKVKGYGPDQVELIPAFYETKEELVCPKFWPHDFPIDWDVRDQDRDAVEPLPHAFELELKPFQLPIVTEVERLLRTDHGAILQVGCGKGKTIMSLFLASRLGLKTAILVNEHFLMTQWRERITLCLPNASVGFVQRDQVEIEGKDFVICMLHSIVLRKYPRSLFQGIGFLIVDECHTVGSPLFSQALHRLQAPYTLGLSATPKRADGMDKLFRMQLGQQVYQHVDDDPVSVRVMAVRFPACISMQFNFRHKPDYVNMTTELSTAPDRHRMLCAVLWSIWHRGDRVTLVLSHRREQLDHLARDLQEHGVPAGDVGFYVGGMKQEALDSTATSANIMLATYHIAKQGLDIPRLNTLVMATPMKEVEQSVGRVTRLSGLSLTPWVIDVCDELPCFVRMFEYRKTLYDRKGFDVSEGSWEDLLDVLQ
jgi:superfamily II DNA or RNA helicase